MMRGWMLHHCGWLDLCLGCPGLDDLRGLCLHDVGCSFTVPATERLAADPAALYASMHTRCLILSVYTRRQPPRQPQADVGH